MPTYSSINAALDASGIVNICGKAFASKDVEIRFLGKKINNITSLDWKETYDKEYITVAGQYGKILGEGDTKVDGSMTILLDELFQLADSTIPVSPVNHSIGDIAPFPITITYFSSLTDIRNTVILNASFTSNGGSAYKAGDKATYKDLEFIATHVRNY